MRIKVNLLAIVCLLMGISPLLPAQDGNGFQPGHYHGMLEDIYPFTLILEETESGDLSGIVLFPLSGDSLIAEVDDLGERIMITEFDQNLTQAGYYLVEKSGDNWAGNWQNQTGSVFLNIHFSRGDESESHHHKTASANKWYEEYYYEGSNYSGKLILLRQAGYAVSAVLYSDLYDSPVILRGDCRERPQCEHILLSGEAGSQILFIELHRDSLQAVARIQSQTERTVILEKQFATVSRPLYSFNQYFVFDAVIPELDDLLTAALQERASFWQMEATQAYRSRYDEVNPDVLRRFSNRNYVWTQILYRGQEYISGFIEWIHLDQSQSVHSFLLDKRKREVFWDFEIFNAGNGSTFAENFSSACRDLENGVPVLTPGGIQFISQLDIEAGRNFCFLDRDEVRSMVNRNLRNLMDEGNLKNGRNE